VALHERLSQLQRDESDLHEQLWRREVVEMVHEYVERELPPGTRLLVVSRGDDDIIDFDGRVGEHFPQAQDGRYAGHHPADSAAAIAHLTALRDGGAEYLVIPGTSQWWLEHYEEFARHLEDHYQQVAAQDRGYVVYALMREVLAA